jgi:hypothetical protein
MSGPKVVRERCDGAFYQACTYCLKSSRVATRTLYDLIMQVSENQWAHGRIG